MYQSKKSTISSYTGNLESRVTRAGRSYLWCAKLSAQPFRTPSKPAGCSRLWYGCRPPVMPTVFLLPVLLCVAVLFLSCFDPRNQNGPWVGAVDAAAMSLLKKGDMGQEVREIQRMLSESGLRVTVDGHFGDRTEAAVKLFQRQNGLRPDGVVGQKTRIALQEEAQKRARSDLSSGSSSSGSPSLVGKDGTFYVVKKNETLSEIAKKIGVPTSLLCKINGIKNPNFIKEGQKLIVPESSAPNNDKPEVLVGQTQTPSPKGNTYGHPKTDTSPTGPSKSVSYVKTGTVDAKGGKGAQSPTSAVNNLRSIEVGRIYTPAQLKGILEALAPAAGSLGISRGASAPGSRSDDLRKTKEGFRVALTFDDGPFPTTTPMIVDILKQNGSSATFFVVGSMAVQHPGLLRRIVGEGHALGNHSYSHCLSRGLSSKDLENEIGKTNAIIQNLTGSSPKFFRPPHGDFSKNVVDVAVSYGLTVVAWSNVGFNDYPPPENIDEFVRDLTTSMTDGYIIMLHDGLSSTVALLPKLIKSIKNSGAKIVPLSEVLNHQKFSMP